MTDFLPLNQIINLKNVKPTEEIKIVEEAIDTESIKSITKSTAKKLKKEFEKKKESSSEEDDDESGSDSSSSSSASGKSKVSVFSDIDKKRKNQETEDKFKQLSEITREYRLKINRFRNMGGYNVPELTGNEKIEQLQIIFDNLKYEQRFKSNIKFFRMIIGFIGYIIEQVGVRIGFSSLQNFNIHLRNHVQEFDEFYEEMTEPTYITHENGTITKVEKNNIITYATSKPELGLMFRFATMASVYSAANSMDTLANLLGD